MSFGDGIASVCQNVEDKHGKFWAWVAFIAIFGSAIGGGLGIGAAIIHAEDFTWQEGYKCGVDGELFLRDGLLEYCPRHAIALHEKVVMRREWHDLRLHEAKQK